jgi:hypothetical protein
MNDYSQVFQLASMRWLQLARPKLSSKIYACDIQVEEDSSQDNQPDEEKVRWLASACAVCNNCDTYTLIAKCFSPLFYYRWVHDSILSNILFKSRLFSSNSNTKQSLSWVSHARSLKLHYISHIRSAAKFLYFYEIQCSNFCQPKTRIVKDIVRVWNIFLIGYPKKYIMKISTQTYIYVRIVKFH